MGTNQYSLFCVCNCRRTFHNAGELNNRDNSEYGWTLDDHVWVKIACLLRNPNNRAEIEAKPSSIQANSKDGKYERKEMGEYHFLCALVASLVCKPQIFHIYSTHADEMSKPQSDAGFTFWPNAIDANVYCFFWFCLENMLTIWVGISIIDQWYHKRASGKWFMHYKRCKIRRMKVCDWSVVSKDFSRQLTRTFWLDVDGDQLSASARAFVDFVMHFKRRWNNKNALYYFNVVFLRPSLKMKALNAFAEVTGKKSAAWNTSREMSANRSAMQWFYWI